MNINNVALPSLGVGSKHTYSHIPTIFSFWARTNKLKLYIKHIIV